MDEQGINKVLNQTAEYPHLTGLLNKIHNMKDFPVLAEISECEEINRILTDLNHIIRLCNVLELSEDPLQSLNDTENKKANRCNRKRKLRKTKKRRKIKA